MVPEVPPERIFDLFTRIDDLLALNLEATKKLTEAINKLTAALAAAPPVAPVAPPKVVVAPPPAAPTPAEFVPLTKDLNALKTSLEEYRKQDLQGRPVAFLDRVSNYSETAYKKVVEWRVGDVWSLGKGRIQEISMVTSDYNVTRFKLTVMGRVYFKDKNIEAPLTLVFLPHIIPQGEKVTLECCSDGTTSITVDGSITGKEFG